MAIKHEENFLNIGGMTLERFLTLALLEEMENNIKKHEIQKTPSHEKEAETQE